MKDNKYTKVNFKSCSQLLKRLAFGKPGSAGALPLISVHSRLSRLCAAASLLAALNCHVAVFKLIDYINALLFSG